MNTLKNKRILLLLLACILSLAIFLSQCTNNKVKVEDSYFLNLQDTVNYVGMDKCKICHFDKYEDFMQTGMGRSFRLATAENSNADFLHAKAIYDNKLHMWFQPFLVGKNIWIKQFRLSGTDTIFSRSEMVKYIIGSGHHTNSHIWTDNGYLYQAPLTFYTQSGKWDLPPGFEHTNTGFNRAIDVECMSCHNAIPSVADGSINKFLNVPVGIDCERCHGPGEMHVNLKNSGVLVDVKKETDRSIVNPARLPWKLQVDVCQRCHLQGNNILQPGKKFTDFKPGMKLEDVFVVYMSNESNNDEFYMAGHAERLQKSACFIQSNRVATYSYNPKLNLTCITCHNPHISVKKTNNQKFNNACMHCHNTNGASKLKKCSGNQQEIAKANNNCVQCHMPKNNTADIPHVTVHDHYIRRPGQKEKQNNKALLYAVNSTNTGLRNDILGYITWYEKFGGSSDYLNKAKDLLANNKNLVLQIHYLYANADFTGIAALAKQINNSDSLDAWTCYRIAKALDKNGQTNPSIQWYRIALGKAKYNASFAAEFANALLRAKQWSESAHISKQTLLQQPKHVLSLVNLGACEYRLKNTSKAIQYLLQATKLEPDNENANLYLAEIYIQNGDNKRAKGYLQSALRVNSSNETAAKLLQSIVP